MILGTDMDAPREDDLDIADEYSATVHRMRFEHSFHIPYNPRNRDSRGRPSVLSAEKKEKLIEDLVATASRKIWSYCKAQQSSLMASMHSKAISEMIWEAIRIIRHDAMRAHEQAADARESVIICKDALARLMDRCVRHGIDISDIKRDIRWLRRDDKRRRPRPTTAEARSQQQRDKGSPST